MAGAGSAAQATLTRRLRSKCARDLRPVAHVIVDTPLVVKVFSIA